MNWFLTIGTAGLLSLAPAGAQTGLTGPATPTADTSTASMTTASGPEVLSFGQLAEQGQVLLAQATANGSGSAGVTLARYPGNYTMLTARNKSGGAELHRQWSDFLFVLSGSGVELTGGTVVLPKEQAGGEIRGLRLDGATPHALKTGDVIHIPAGTPHQSIEEPGQSLVVFVIKVAVPNSTPSEGVTR